jgi:hypothetical protein
VIIIDLIYIDSENEFERSTSDNRYRPSLLPEFKIVSSKFDNKQNNKYIRKQILGLYITCPAFVLLDSINISYTLIDILKTPTTKVSKDESTS